MVAKEEAGGIYRKKAARAEGVPFEYYQSNCCEYRLMKCKAKGYDCSGMDFAAADVCVKAVRQRLIVVQLLIRAITFAMELVGSKSIKWDNGKETNRGNTTKLEQNASYLGAELKRVIWKETQICS